MIARPELATARTRSRRCGPRTAHLAWLAVWGCACPSSPPLATLELAFGTVERDRAAEQGVWQAASVGARFDLGDGVQTFAASTALLQLADAAQLSLEPQTRIRFSNTRPEPHTLDLALELGSLSVYAAEESLAIQTSGGRAQVAAGSRVALSRLPHGVQFLVQIGKAVFDGSAPVEAGYGMMLQASGWTVLPPTAPAPAALPPTAPAPAALPPSDPLAAQSISAGERARLLPNAAASLEGRSLDYADVTMPAGQSVVIHDPTPPTALRFEFGSACAGFGSLQLSSNNKQQGYAVGENAVALAIRAGAYRYELRCGQGKSVAAQGRVQVLRDSGTRSIAARPPAMTLQADGRDYTVLYQSRLPEITLVWREAPAGKELRLIHEHESQRETLTPREPSHTFASGRLKEGRHVLHFEGSGKLSRPTTINVAFDNAAPTATIATPPRARAEPGELVNISGTTLPGWDVSVEGQPARRDAQGRFSASVPWPSAHRAVAVRLSHPERGIHLYLRRAEP